MCRMSKKAWSDAHDRFGRLSRDELLAASEELRTNRTVKNPDVKWLLRELSIFGHAHPLSNESRLNMRRKIFSLCIKYGLPAIWFTINPNDLANPVRLKMTAYRGAQGLEAKGLLDQMTKRFPPSPSGLVLRLSFRIRHSCLVVGRLVVFAAAITSVFA